MVATVGFGGEGGICGKLRSGEDGRSGAVMPWVEYGTRASIEGNRRGAELGVMWVMGERDVV